MQDYWSSDSDDMIRKLWADISVPAQEIGSSLSPPRTKNAVIGRARRLNLPARRVKGGRPTNRMNFTKESVRRRKSVNGIFFANPVNPDQLPLPIEMPIAPHNWSPIGVPLLEATGLHCRAVIASSADSRGLAIFCGHPIVWGQPFSFCEYHLGRYIRPRRKR